MVLSPVKPDVSLESWNKRATLQCLKGFKGYKIKLFFVRTILCI